MLFRACIRFIFLLFCLVSYPLHADDQAARRVIDEAMSVVDGPGGVSNLTSTIYFEAHDLRIASGMRQLLNDPQFLAAYPDYAELSAEQKRAFVRAATHHDYNKRFPNGRHIAEHIAENFGKPFSEFTTEERIRAQAMVDELNSADTAHMKKLFRRLKFTPAHVKLFEDLEEVLDRNDRYFAYKLCECYDYNRKMTPLSSFYEELKAKEIEAKRQGIPLKKFFPDFATVQELVKKHRKQIAEELGDNVKFNMAKYIETPGNYPYKLVYRGYKFAEYTSRRLGTNKSYKQFAYEQSLQANTPPVSEVEMEANRKKIARKKADKQRIKAAKNATKTARKVGGLALRVTPLALPYFVYEDVKTAIETNNGGILFGLLGTNSAHASTHASDMVLDIEKLYSISLEEQTDFRLSYPELEKAAANHIPLVTNIQCNASSIRIKAAFGPDTMYKRQPIPITLKLDKGKISSVSIEQIEPYLTGFELTLDEKEQVTSHSHRLSTAKSRATKRSKSYREYKKITRILKEFTEKQARNLHLCCDKRSVNCKNDINNKEEMLNAMLEKDYPNIPQTTVDRTQPRKTSAK